MNILFDWILIIICSIFVYNAFRNICFQKNCSISNFVICVVYVFCVLPILLNYLIGIPNYRTVYWYKPFIEPMYNESISVIYDLYIIFSMVVLFIYSKKYKVKDISNVRINIFNTKFINNIIILLPLIYIFISGTYKNYFTYNTQSLRGFDLNTSNYFTILMSLIFLSLFTYYSNFFKKDKKSLFDYFIFIIYNFFIIWIVGKRFIFANIFITILYYLSQSQLKDKTRRKIFVFTPIFILFLVLFAGFYLKNIRPLSDTSFDSIYEMLRVDFGRDDVIKYTIKKEIVDNKRILDYRGQTILGLLFQYVPRKIWPNKPYPHYMYLTSSILNLDISNLPAGTTPSYYEMVISNFGIFGFVFGVISLVILCYFADKSKHVDTKYIWAILIVVLLTQSMDSYIIYIFIMFVYKIIQIAYKIKKEIN